MNPPPPELVLRRGEIIEICAVLPRNFCDPASSQLYNSGWGGGGGGSQSIRSQLRALATHTPSLGRVGQSAGCKPCHKLGSAIFLVTLAWLDISSKKRCLQRLFISHFKAHTISNKLVSKVFAQKQGGKSYDSYKYVFQFRWFQV